MNWSRRDLCAVLPSLLALPASASESMGTLTTKVYKFEDMPVHPGKNMVIRSILDGRLTDGLPISLHESDLGPRGVPHPPHRHHHEELILITEGTLEFIVKGVVTRASAGSLLFAASMDEHGIRNPTDAHAKYFVLSLGAEPT